MSAVCERWDRTKQSIPLFQVSVCFQMSGKWVSVFLGGFHIQSNDEQTCKAKFRAEGPCRQQHSPKAEQLPQRNLTLAEIMQGPSGYKHNNQILASKHKGFDQYDPFLND